jgi:hypothetical protein
VSEQADLFSVCDVCGGVGGDHVDVTVRSGAGDSSTRRCPRAPLSDLDEPAIGGFRRGDPDTSRQAAIDQYRDMGPKKRKVLAAFVQVGSRGLTHSELTQRLAPNDPDTSTWRTRARELRKGGWLVDSGFKRKTPSGKASKVWLLSDAAKQELASRQVTAAE